jgi:hypothetical protein
MAVSAWVGGLFYFSAVLVHAMKGTKGAYYLALILPRFSLIATASLGAIGVTGLYMAWVQLQSLDSLFNTPYGTNLIIKLAAALPMVMLGAYHQIKLHRSIVTMATIGKQSSTSDAMSGDGGYDGASRFNKTIKAESLIGIGVLLAASFLTITSPPSHTHQVGMPGGTDGYSQGVAIDGVDITLAISPFHAGFNTFSVSLLEAGTAPQNINAVYLRFTNVDAGIGPIIATLEGEADGVYSSTGGYLSQSGNWRIDLIVQRIGAYDLNHSFEAELASTHEMDMDEMQGMNDAGMETMGVERLFDSFAMMTVGLAAATIGASVLFYKKSSKQLRETVDLLKD